MILREETRLAEENAKKQITKFAWFPKKLQRSTDDEGGAVIWLEQYVEFYRTERVRRSSAYDTWEWKLYKTERVAKLALAKFEQ